MKPYPNEELDRMSKREIIRLYKRTVEQFNDAVPVRHGKWELAKDGWYCSACELYPPFDCDPEEKGIPYCPNCGADMRGEKE